MWKSSRCASGPKYNFCARLAAQGIHWDLDKPNGKPDGVPPAPWLYDKGLRDQDAAGAAGVTMGAPAGAEGTRGSAPDPTSAGGGDVIVLPNKKTQKKNLHFPGNVFPA